MKTCITAVVFSLAVLFGQEKPEKKPDKPAPEKKDEKPDKKDDKKPDKKDDKKPEKKDAKSEKKDDKKPEKKETKPAPSPFPDKNLEAAVKEALVHAKGDLSDQSLGNLFFLDARKKGIKDL